MARANRWSGELRVRAGLSMMGDYNDNNIALIRFVKSLRLVRGEWG